MNDTLTSLLMNNIDLILEAHNVDSKGNLVEINKKKVAECDAIFHEYFVKKMNGVFRQINEADPILDPMQGGDTSMNPAGDMNGMHPMGQMPHGMGGGHMGGGMQPDHMGNPGMGDPGLGDPGMSGGDLGDDMMGNMAMDDMHGGMNRQMHNQNPSMGGGMAGGMAGGGMGGAMGESTDLDWVFGENTDLEIDSLFNLTEDDDEEEAEQEDDENLNEFMDEEHDDQDFLPGGGGMGGGMGGGSNDFGGDMGGMDDSGMGGMDDMGGMGGGDMGGGMEGDMITIHGQTDSGGDFEFSFDKDALDFDGDEGGMGGQGDDFGGGDEGGQGEHQFGGGHMGNEPGMGSGEHEDEEEPFHEAAGRKPGKGKRGPKTSRMAIVPASPAASHAAPFPTSMGQKQKRK